MVAPAAGKVVLVRFPFSDLSSAKLRPAVVVASAGHDDWILCQVTSNPYADPAAVEIAQSDLATGSLHRTSYARPGKLFTASASLMVQEVGILTAGCHAVIVASIVKMLQSGLAR